eukprot:1329700-Amorphochlora_amoeboformis.AAC.2
MSYPASEVGILHHPREGYPCIWYEIKVYEIRHWKEHQEDQNGAFRYVDKQRAEVIYSSQEGSKFWLSSGSARLLVNVKNAEQSKISTTHNVTFP